MAASPLDEEAIFKIAARISAADVRQDYLQQACGDNGALLRRVRALLRAHDSVPGFLESPPVSIAATIDLPPIAERPGIQIGPYKLIQEIGEGGMGMVFMALQKEPVRRKVALKIIKPGMDTREVIARFEAEEQALAMMDHPNIARVLDAAATDSGRPYFVMELVNGVPLTDYCDDNSLNTRERLELFVTVCRAVQHAHQKGIIHRDLKPSNILVTLHDGEPVPKIIDFGIAKAVNQELTSKTLATGVGHMIGTPLYMSPEQAERSGLDIDTRSDIYSLGVLLYELLTGSTPFDREQFKDTPLEEIRRVIREEEPPRPSTRISTLGQAATTVSAHRRTDPVQLSNALRHELDWIVMKALEKDRTRRYATANDFARDIERYLHDEPVEACPPSAVYRTRKYMRRHKLAIAVTSLFVLSLVVAIGALFWAGKSHAELAARRLRVQHVINGALQDALQVTARASAQPEEGKAALNSAREKLQLAGEVAKSGPYDPDLTAQLWTVNEELVKSERDLQLLEALKQARLSPLPLDPALARFGEHTNRIALLHNALEAYGISMRAHTDAPPESMVDVRSLLQDRPQAIKDAVFIALHECLMYADLYHAAGPEPGVATQSTPRHRRQLGAVRVGAGPEIFAEDIRTIAQVMLDQLSAASSQANAGVVDVVLDDAKEPLQSFFCMWSLDNSQIKRRWIVDFLESEDRDPWRQKLRRICFLTDSDERQRLWDELANDRNVSQQPVHLLVRLAGRQVSPERAIRLLKDVQQQSPGELAVNVCLAEKLMEADPPQMEDAIRYLTGALALIPHNVGLNADLGVALHTLGRLDEANAAITRSLAVANDKAAAHFGIGCTFLRFESYPEAIHHFRAATRCAPQSAVAHNNLGLALFAAGQLQEAMEQYREAIRLQPNMAIAHNNLGKALEANGELQEALSEYSRAIGIEWIFTGARVNLLAARGKLEPSSRDSLRELVRVQEESPLALHFVGQAHPYAGTFDLNQGLTIAESCEVLLVKYIQTLVLLRDDPQEGMVGTTSGCD